MPVRDDRCGPPAALTLLGWAHYREPGAVIPTARTGEPDLGAHLSGSSSVSLIASRSSAGPVDLSSLILE